jgi:hypothetical protein
VKDLTEIQARTYPFGELFKQESKLIIPSYQREYRWAPQQVKTFVRDAIKAVMDDAGARYYGPATLSGDAASNERHIVDGQQRTTTAILLVAALRDRLMAAGSHAASVERLNRCLRTRLDSGDVLHHRLESQHPAANDVIKAIIAGKDPGSAGTKAPGLNYVIAYRSIVEVLDAQLTEPERMVAFADAFLEKAGIVVMLTSPANAVEIFIKQHETLSPLGLLDKMKGRLFEKVPLTQQAAFVASFHEAQELLWSMEGRTDRHLLHVLRGMSESGDRTQPQAVVDGAVEAAVAAGVLAYTKDQFLPAVKALDAAMRGCHPSGSTCAPLLDMCEVRRLRRFAGVRSMFVAARGLTDDQRVELFTALRNTLTVLFVARSNPPANEKAFRAWSDGVVAGDLAQVLAAMKAHREENAAAFSTYYPALGLRELGKTGVRFLLGVAENHVRTAMGETCGDAATSRFPTDTFDVEHILPQDPASWGNFVDAGSCVDRLGNLTMLEATRNRSIRNSSHATKLDEYKTSGIFLTRSMHSSVKGTGKNNKASQGADLLEQFTTWSKSDFEARSKMLYRILAAALDVSEVQVQLTPQASSVQGSPLARNLPQARPGNTLKVLLLVGQGVTEEEDVAARIAGKNDTGADSRQASYCMEALDFMGLAESDEGVFSLTDPGRELFEEIEHLSEERQMGMLSGAYARAFKALPGGDALIGACQDPGSTPGALQAAAKVMYPSLSESTLKHRCGALRAWFSPDDTSSADEDRQLLPLF